VETKPLRKGFDRFYQELEPALGAFGQALAIHLRGERMHLDPDFATLTYGDQGRRAKQIESLTSDDLVAFYASLRDVNSQRLVYCLIGLFVIDHICRAANVPQNLWGNNAHTRRVPGPDDVVVYAVPEDSGRCERLLEIGEYRDRAYRVRRPLLQAWDDLTVRDGYLQRSARLPEFKTPQKFYRWFKSHRMRLLHCNN